MRPLALFDPDLDPLDDDLLAELFDEEEADLDEPPVLEAPVLRDDVEADFAPRDEDAVFDPPVLLELPPLLPDALFALEDFEAALLFDEVLLVPDEDPPREDADDLLLLDFDELPDEPLLDDDDLAELLLPADEPLFPDELLLPDDELLLAELLPDEDELLPDDAELLPDDVLLRLPDELLRDEPPLVLPPLVEPLVELPVGATISTAVDAAPTTAPVAAPPRRSVATSATLSMMVLTAEVVLEPLDFFEELEAERF